MLLTYTYKFWPILHTLLQCTCDGPSSESFFFLRTLDKPLNIIYLWSSAVTSNVCVRAQDHLLSSGVSTSAGKASTLQ